VCYTLLVVAAAMQEQVHVSHQPAKSRFVASLPEGEAYVEYAFDAASNTLDLLHTYTPAALRGRGLAAKVISRVLVDQFRPSSSRSVSLQVVEAAFIYARARRLTIIPSCTYIPVFLARYPSWGSIAAKL
jgi:uncharacterized protein